MGDLRAHKPVIVCGDLNVAHQEIDLKPGYKPENAGFTDEERHKFTELLDSGFIDTFRHFYPDKTDAYTWWSLFFQRQRAEHRVENRLLPWCLKNSRKLKDALIHDQVFGSDHCPVELQLEGQASHNLTNNVIDGILDKTPCVALQY